MQGIYTITNLINGKIYIGFTESFLERKAHHLCELNSNSHKNSYLQKSFNKYGESNFSFDMLIECDKEFLCSEEHYWATLLNVHNRNFGYNIRPTHPDGKILTTPEIREKIRIGNTGKVLSKEHIQKIIDTKIKKYGNRTLLKEQKRQLHIQKKKELKKIKQFSLDGILIKEWNSVEEIKKELKFDSPAIYKNCKGKSKHSYGFLWQFSRDSDIKRRKILKQYDLNKNFIKSWTSKSKASKELGILYYNITYCCVNNRSSAGGFIWSYDIKNYKNEKGIQKASEI